MSKIDPPRTSAYSSLDRPTEDYRYQTENREPRSQVARDFYPKVQDQGYSPATSDFKVQQVFRPQMDDTDRARSGLIAPADQAPRQVFQRNNDAVNQGAKTYNDPLQSSSLKKEEAVNPELNVAKKAVQSGSSMDQENLFSPPEPRRTTSRKKSPQATLVRQPQEMNIESQYTSARPVRSSDPEISIVEEMVMQEFAFEKPLEKSNAPVQKEEVSNHQEIATSNVSDDGLLFSQKNSDQEEEKEQSGHPIVPRLDQSDQASSIASGEGENKENIAPTEATDATKEIKSSNEVEGPNQLMDFDKEPAFAEDNLEGDSSVIVDDEKNQQVNQPSTGPVIQETEMIVVDPSNGRVTDELQTTSTQNHLQEPTQKLESQRQLSASRTRYENTPSSGNEERRTFTNLKASVVRKKSEALVAQKASAKEDQKSPNSRSSLVKRPPMRPSEGRPEPSTPKSKQPSSISQRSLQASKESLKNRNDESALRLKASARTTSPGLFTRVAEDMNKNKLSLSKFLHKPSDRKTGELKLACDIPQRQAEAEAVLSQRKPPVPKFCLAKESREPKEKSKTSSRVTSQEQLPRKPSVPKLVELLKKKAPLP